VSVSISDRESYRVLEAAVRHLTALDDDYAQDQNGMGWNKPDSYPGHGLAEIAFADWTEAEIVWAYQLSFRYRDQLAGVVEPDALPKIEGAFGKFSSGAGLGRRQPAKPNPRFIDVVDNRLVFHYPFSYEINDVIKSTFAGRAFNGMTKKWSAPFTRENAALALGFARQQDFAITPSAQALIERLFDGDSAEDVIAEALVEVDTRKAEQAVKDAPFALMDRGTLQIGWGFGYPRFTEIKDAVKAAGFRFDGTTKRWGRVLASFNAETVAAVIREYDVRVEPELIVKLADLSASYARNVVASKAEDAPLSFEDLPEGLAPFPYQAAGVSYVLDNDGRVIIGDEMGLGKTIQALLAILKRDAFPLVVVCPASVKLNWAREIKKWLGIEATVLNGKAVEVSALGRATVINYDILGKWMPILLAAGFRGAIVDESHYIKNDSDRTDAVLRLLAGYERTVVRNDKGKKVKGRRVRNGEPIPTRILLTGTAVENRPMELANQLMVIDRLDDLGGSNEIRRRYCEYEFNGYGWDYKGPKLGLLPELNERLRATCYVRREKAQVQKELPAKLHQTMVVEITNRAEYERAEQDVLEYVKEQVAKNKALRQRIISEIYADPEVAPSERSKLIAARIREEMNTAEAKAERAKFLVKIAKTRQIAAIGKMKAVEEQVQAFLDSTDKSLIVWAHHQSVQDRLLETFKSYQPVHILGSDSAEARQAAVDAFQAKTARLMIASIGAAREGITLTAASDAFFVEFAWTPSRLAQAEDRIHRIGQDAEMCNYVYFVGDETVDQDILELVESKRKMAQATLVGAESEEENVNLLDELVERMGKRAAR
jgi:hypothetical protein